MPTRGGQSDALLDRVLVLAGRGPVIELRRLDVLKETLVSAIAAIEEARK